MTPPEPTTPEIYLSPREFARLAGLSEKTVHRYLKSGRLPKYQPGGPTCRVGIPRSALNILATQSATSSTSTSGAPPTSEPKETSATPSTNRPLHAPRWKRQRP